MRSPNNRNWMLSAACLGIIAVAFANMAGCLAAAAGAGAGVGYAVGSQEDHEVDPED